MALHTLFTLKIWDFIQNIITHESIKKLESKYTLGCHGSHFIT